VGALLTWLFCAGLRRRIKLVQEEKQQLRQEKQIVVEFMHNMVAAVTEGSDREVMFQRIIHAAILSTGAISACIYEKQSDNTLKGVAVEGLFPPQKKLPADISEQLETRTQFLEKVLKSESFLMGEGLIGQVGKSKRGELIADASKDPRVVQHDDPVLKIRSIIISPVVFKGKLVAVLVVANPLDGLDFDETDFSLVESLSEHVGLAIHNSDAVQLQIEKNKFDLDMELAGDVQGLLLPKKFPMSGRVEFAAVYTAAQKVGGDLYDVFRLSEHKIGVAIADVSGKGISASILMAICQTNFRHFAKKNLSPAEVLRAVNAEMESSMRKDMFITMLYAILDLDKSTITFARAGHELPLFYYSRGDCSPITKFIGSPGMALGMVPPEIFDHTLADETTDFASGDALILYTDGITESVNSLGEEFSGERLACELAVSGKGSASVILEKIVGNLNAFSSDEGQSDDLTLLAIKHL